MNPTNCTLLFRSNIRACIIASAILLMVGCTQPQITPTAVLTVTVPVVPTRTVTLTLTNSPSPTWTDTPTETASPTITDTLAPTLTPHQVDMNFSPTERAVFSVDNPYQYCFLTYFDLTLEPGHIGVWERDSTDYFVCIARIEP